MTFKSILFGAAAGLLSIGAALAADLPMAKGEAVEYVKVCSTFGPGFFYIPGSDTCLKLSGQIRADYYYSQVPSDSKSKRTNDQTTFRTNARVRWDARTQTDYGLLRSFIEMQVEVKGATTSFAVRQAYLQFGGLTAGYAWSPYAFYDPNYAAPFFAPYFGEQGRRNLISYTAQFGKAFVTGSIEGNREHSMSTATFGGSSPYNAVGGSSMPDIVGVIGYDDNKSGWGRVQVMGALHQSRSTLAKYGSEYGYSVGIGGNVNIPLLAGAYIAGEASYADGAVKYLGVGAGNPNSDSLLSIGGSDAYVTNGAPYDLARAKGFAIQAEAGLKFTKQWQAFCSAAI